MDRFERQCILPEFGQKGQVALRRARVGVAGAGGLGCPVLLYLAAAGIGFLGIADGDVVELSNLHRQVLFGTLDIGKSKAETAARRLREQYNDVEVVAFSEYLNQRNLLDWVDGFDVIVDSTDHPAIRYMLADACYILDKPLVYGAIFRNQGQLSFFHCSADRRAVHLRDIFPFSVSTLTNCVESGVLGVLPGIIGTLQAAEVIKYLSGYGTPLLNTLLVYQLNTQQFDRIQIDPGAYNGPEDRDAFKSWPYQGECQDESVPIDTLHAWLDNELSPGAKKILVDVRETHELKHVGSEPSLHIPLMLLEKRSSELAPFQSVAFLCNSGQRSRQAAAIMQRIYPGKQYFALRAVEKIN